MTRMKKSVATVKEAYDIDEALLSKLADKEALGNFFINSLAFYEQVKDRPARSMTGKQMNWLNEIQGVLHDRAEED